MTTLVPKPLTREDALDLGPRIRQADIDDLTVHRSNPTEALLGALAVPGESYGVWDGEHLIGAGGWTEAGHVWTLWTDLSSAQSRALLKACIPWARIMAIRSMRPLGNVFLTENHVTRAWLRATRCVELLDVPPIMWQGFEYTPFRLKPLEQLPYV